MRVIAARIGIKGFIVLDFFPRLAEFYARNGAVGRRRHGQVARDGGRGLEKTPDAFLGLFQGANTGKMLVRL